MAIGALLLAALSVPRQDCFPLERLPREIRPLSESLLLRALDNEALYTIASDLKPVSGVIEFRVPIEKPDLSEIENTRDALRAWTCGDFFFADVRHFRQPHGDRAHARPGRRRPLLHERARVIPAHFL